MYWYRHVYLGKNGQKMKKHIKGLLGILCTCMYKGVFIVCCNAAALPRYRLLIYHSSTQHTVPQLQFTSLQYRNAVVSAETEIRPLQRKCSRLWTQLKNGNFVMCIAKPHIISTKPRWYKQQWMSQEEVHSKISYTDVIAAPSIEGQIQWILGKLVCYILCCMHTFSHFDRLFNSC